MRSFGGKLKWWVACCVVATAAGCATPYNSEGGFLQAGGRVVPLGGDTYRVAFSTSVQGSTFGQRETLQAYWLYRCVELTLEKGYDGFVVIGATPFVDGPDNLSMKDIQGKLRLPLIETNRNTFLTADIILKRAPFDFHPPKSFDARALKAALEPYVHGALCEGQVCPHPKPYLYPDQFPAK